MGNTLVVSCFHQNPTSLPSCKLIFWEGTTTILKGNHIAREILFEFPDKIICHADSFFIGHPVPALSIDEELIIGQTYFVLPIDLFANNNVLSTSSISALGSSSSPNNKRVSINFGDCPFEYLKGANGRVLIKVVPEFITKLISNACSGNKEMLGCDSNSTSPSYKAFLCSTPELQKHYEQLVGSKEQVWSPKLETISEQKLRCSPCRFLGLEYWKQKENASF